MAARGGGAGRGQGSGKPATVAPQRGSLPAGYSDSDNSDDDNYFSPTLAERRPMPLKVLPTQQIPSVGASSTSSRTTTYDDDDWSVPVPASIPSSARGSSSIMSRASAAGTGGGAAKLSEQPWPEPAPTGSTLKTNFSNAGGITPKVRDPLPMIPNINRQRCIAATRSINAVWSNGRSEQGVDVYASGIAKTLRTEFKDARNPYATALNLMLYTIDFFKPSYKGSLSLEVMKEFKKWLLDSGGLSSYERQFLDLELQKTAFSVAMKQPSSAVIKLVFELYCLKSIASTFVEPINKFCETGAYKEACLAATYLGLFTEFDVHKFVIPLILQNREQIALDYLIGSVDNQDAMVKFFDDILGDPTPVNAMRNYVFAKNIDNVMFTKLEVKAMGKQLERLRSKLGIDQTTCPNNSRRKKGAALRHLMYRKYMLKDDTMSEMGFEELLDDLVAKDEGLIEEALAQFREYVDSTAAAKFAIRNAVPLHKITFDVQVRMNELNPNVVVLPEKGTVQQWEQDWDLAPVAQAKTRLFGVGQQKSERSLTPSLQNCPKPGIFPPAHEKDKSVRFSPSAHRSRSRSRSPLRELVSLRSSLMDSTDDSANVYKCPIQSTKIHVLYTPEMISDFIEELEEAQKAQADQPFPFVVVGFDSEWKPMLGTTGVSLMQIALPTKIYLIDTFELKQTEPNSECWTLLLERFFENEKILKLGVAIMKNDVPMLAKTTPVWANMIKAFKGVVDLSQLATDLGRANSQIFQNFVPAKAPQGLSLSDLVLAFTGLRMKKDEQFSNWEKRPLREAQILYAAADAYCQLDVFNVMQSRAERAGLNFLTTVLRVVEKWEGQVDKTLKKMAPNNSLRDFIANVIHGHMKIPVPVDSPFQMPRLPSDIKLICDNVLAGIGRLLRICGVDTVVLENQESFKRYIDIAAEDNRCVITTKNTFSRIAPFLPDRHCYVVNNPVNPVESLKDVLGYFNIVVTDLNMHTRCQSCNSNEFVKIRSELLKELYMDKFPEELRGKQQEKYSGLMEIDEDTIAANSAVGADAGENRRRWTLIPENTLVTEGPSDVLRTKRGAVVGVKGISMGVVNKVEYIYACNVCGKCYWANQKTPKASDAAQPDPIFMADDDDEQAADLE